MTDRELLELAAKAAEIDISDATFDGWGTPIQTKWNPLKDDGDALRLAVELGLVVDCSRPSAGEPYKQHAVLLDKTGDNATLTRRAIVRAAAEIGKAMK
jgi:hypothetical protein